MDELPHAAAVKESAALGLSGARMQLLFGARLLQPIEGQFCIPCMLFIGYSLLAVGTVVPFVVIGMLWRGSSLSGALDAATDTPISLTDDGGTSGNATAIDPSNSVLLWPHFAGRLSEWRVAILFGLCAINGIFPVIPHCL